jgi:glutamine cyclotransferase
MDDSTVEMVAWADRKDVDGLELDQAHDNPISISLHAAVQRQDRWCGCSLLFIVTSMAVLFVSQVYMTPADSGIEIEPGLLPSRTPRQPETGSTTEDEHVHHPHTANTDINAGGTISVFDADKWIESNVTLEDGVMFQTIRELQHDRGAFLEGLTFAQGFLYESTGLEGESSIRKLDASTGDIVERFDLEDKSVFAEGLTMANGKLYQLTYKKKIGYIYDMNNISLPTGTFAFESTTGEGWGLTYSPETNELIMSDGSAYLHMINADTLQPTRNVQVTRRSGKRADNINELEYFHGYVLANVWFQDIILVINPSTGVVEKEYDLATLWPEAERSRKGAGVLNGISISADPSRLYVTGKNWERMFLIE